MRIITEVIGKMEKAMDEAEAYAVSAIHLKPSFKSLADVYIKIANEHMEMYKMLHGEVVDLISEEKRKGVNPPAEMMAIWEYMHERLTSEFASVKVLIESY